MEEVGKGSVMLLEEKKEDFHLPSNRVWINCDCSGSAIETSLETVQRRRPSWEQLESEGMAGPTNGAENFTIARLDHRPVGKQLIQMASFRCQESACVTWWGWDAQSSCCFSVNL